MYVAEEVCGFSLKLLLVIGSRVRIGVPLDGGLLECVLNQCLLGLIGILTTGAGSRHARGILAGSC